LTNCFRCRCFLFVAFFGVFASSACSEDSRWPADAAIEVSDVGATTAVVTWPPVKNAKEIDGYVIYVGDRAPEKVLRTTLLFALEGLLAGAETEIRIEVVRDGSGRGSLSTTVRTLDGTPPTWTLGQVLGVKAQQGEEDGLRTLALSWPEANDNVGVTGYRVVVDGEVVKTVDGDALATEISIEYAETVLRVVAGDAAGNWSPLGIIRVVPAQLRLDFGRAETEPNSLLGSSNSAGRPNSP
jgi:hypothetical protein